MDQKIKWILFDLSGVIVKWIFINPAGYMVKSRFFDVKKFDDLFFTKDHLQYCLGHLSHEQFVERFIKRAKLDLSIEEFNELAQKDITLNSGMNTLIERLSHTYKIGVATNEGKLFTKYKIEGSGVLPYLSKIVASYRIHLVKPDKAFYEKTLESINANAEECIFIDDTKENITAANSLGMKGILFTSPHQLEQDLNALHIL
jgi:putative hydrolase of the HAD superfamily